MHPVPHTRHAALGGTFLLFGSLRHVEQEDAGGRWGAHVQRVCSPTRPGSLLRGRDARNVYQQRPIHAEPFTHRLQGGRGRVGVCHRPRRLDLASVVHEPHDDTCAILCYSIRMLNILRIALLLGRCQG